MKCRIVLQYGEEKYVEIIENVVEVHYNHNARIMHSIAVEGADRGGDFNIENIVELECIEDNKEFNMSE